MNNARNTRMQPPFKKVAYVVIWVFLAQVAGHSALWGKESPLFAEGVNLALRRTAHQLLRENGDTLSTIPPVEEITSDIFQIRINGLFDYDQLPGLLQQSLELHGVNKVYNVAIVSCDDGKIHLGYHYLDLASEGGIACQGRQREAGCYLLKVSFPPGAAASAGKWWSIGLGCFVLIGLVVWRRRWATTVLPLEAAAEIEATPAVKFGNSTLDLSNLLLHTGHTICNLTYREAKLLNLFASHQNQVLERDFILKSVWEDEGIVVSRSIDVFVSRLRKLLRDDASIRIAAVHGVGYRMEVGE